MIDIVDYKPEHLARIELKTCHNGERPEEIRGNAVTFLVGETPLAIFGWYFICPGVVQVWGLVSTSVDLYKKSFHKSVRLFIKYSFQKLELRRMQISVRTGYVTGWKWAKRLGFQSEGVMKRYAPDGADCWLFARVSYDGN